jgi:hypothetical protein
VRTGSQPERKATLTPPPARRAPAPSPYYEDLRDELHRIRVATELIAQALGHLIPYFTGDAAEAEGSE